MIAQVDRERSVSCVNVWWNYQYGRNCIVFIAGDLVRNEGVVGKIPETRIDFLGLVLAARQDQGRLFTGKRLARTPWLLSS